MEYVPSDHASIDTTAARINNVLRPQRQLLVMLSALLHGSETRAHDAIRMISTCIGDSIAEFIATHALTLTARLELCIIGLQISKQSYLNQDERRQLLRDSLELLLWWFADTNKWPYGRDLRDAQALSVLIYKCQNELDFLRQHPDFIDYRSDVDLLHHLLDGDIARMKVWLNPLQDSPGSKPSSDYSSILKLVEPSRLLHAKIFVQLATDYRRPQMRSQFLRTLRPFIRTLLYSHEAMHFLIAEKITNTDVSLQKASCESISSPNLKQCLLYGDATSPTSALTYFSPAFRNNPFIVQYAMRSMSSHRIEVMFFYVPQIVQAVRFDSMRTFT